MSEMTREPTNPTENSESQWGKLCTTGGVVALIQLACLLVGLVVAIALGKEPATAQGYFDMFQRNRVEALLRLDFATLTLITLFPILSLGIHAAMRRTHRAYSVLAVMLMIIGSLLSLSTHSAFSMIRLSDMYAAAGPTQQAQLLAAGEAVIASDMWHSTGGFLAGLFMQGGVAFISIIMLRGTRFRKATAITGLISNGLDWLHVLVALFAPALANVMLWVAGPVYLLWFPLLALDLLRMGREKQTETDSQTIR